MGDLNINQWHSRWLSSGGGADAGMLDLTPNDKTYPACAPITTPDRILWRPGSTCIFPRLAEHAFGAGDDWDAEQGPGQPEAGPIQPTWVDHGAPKSCDHLPLVTRLETYQDPAKARSIARYVLPDATSNDPDVVAEVAQLDARLAAAMAEQAADEDIPTINDYTEALIERVAEAVSPWRITVEGTGRPPTRKQFLANHAWHEDAVALEEAYKQDDHAEILRLERIIRAAGWRRFLRGCKVSGSMRPLWRFLAKSDGRLPWLKRTVRSAIKDSHGRWCNTDRAKAAALGAHLRDKYMFQADHPSQLSPATQSALDMAAPVAEVTATEVEAAYKLLGKGKAPGLDDLPLEVWRGPTWHTLAALYTRVLRSEGLPDAFSNSKVIWLDKAGRPPEQMGSYRPISLISTVAKLLERVVLGRLPETEDASQHAYQRGKCTEILLQELATHVDGLAKKGRTILIVQTDIAGAFDSVPHTKLVDQLLRQGIDAGLVRYIWRWLRHRAFCSQVGQERSQWFRPCTGIPQGGALSPWAWNSLLAGTASEVSAKVGAGLWLRFFADDGTAIIDGNSPEECAAIAAQFEEALSASLVARGLRLAPSKMEAMWLDVPKTGVYRRQHDTYGRVRKDPTPVEQPPAQLAAIPYPTKNSLRVLGLLVDHRFTMCAHLAHIEKKCTLRLSILRSLANRHWGLDVATLSQTSLFLVSHILGYGVTIYGSCASQAALQKLNTKIINPAARIVLGTSRTQRLESLYMGSNLQSVFNIYTSRLASFVDRLLRASSTPLRERIAETIPGLRYVYEPALPPREMRAQDPTELAALRPDCPYTTAVTSWTHWVALPPAQASTAQSPSAEQQPARRVYHTYAPELESDQEADRQFAPPAAQCPPWAMEAVKTLESAGWNRHQVQRLQTYRPQVGRLENLRVHSHELAGTRDELAARYKFTGACDGAHLAATGRGASAAYLHSSREARVLAGAWGGNKSSYRPEFTALMDLLGLAIQAAAEEDTAAQELLLLSDAQSVLARIKTLAQCGGLATDAECEMMARLERVSRLYKCIRIQHVYGHTGVTHNEVADTLADHAAALGPAPAEWPQAPTLDDMKGLVKAELDRQEADTMQSLKRAAPSVSGSLCSVFLPDRPACKKLYKELSAQGESREVQVTAASLLGATRFKQLTPAGLLGRMCPKCDAVADTPAHFLECYVVGDLGGLSDPQRLARLFSYVTYETRAHQDERRRAAGGGDAAGPPPPQHRGNF
ncbi:unnamed protein product [Amoebophrya sp. A120]|nr:unnamed protein product [Amoebophrya sp. A120]|eukprot:GSA120T00003515001.1